MDRSRVGGLIRARRNQLDKTLKTLGEAVGLTGAAIGHIETGTNSTSIDTLERIALALDARWSVQLLPASTQGRDPLRTAIVDRLLEVVDELDERDVRMLAATIEAYATEARRAR